MDPVSALGVAAAVVQFIALGVRVSKRLSEYTKAGIEDVPRSLVNISTQLPLLVSALQRAQTEKQVSRYDVDTRLILRGVIIGCIKLVDEIDQISSKLLPQQGENFTTKVRKAFSSLRNDGRVTEIDHGLQSYIQILILHHVVDRDEMPSATPEETRYFEVTEKAANPFYSRSQDIKRIDECLRSVTRLQTKEPTSVIIQADKGTGKSQLALAFCREAYDAGQFQTVFWVTASSPSSLIAGLEGLAAILKRTKDGGTTEKLEYVKMFLIERWRPWLLVLDDYSHEAFAKRAIQDFLPSAGHGAFLFTTRDGDVPGKMIRIHKFLTPEQEGWYRREITQGIRDKNLAQLMQALDTGLDANSLEYDDYGRDTGPMINKAARKGWDVIVSEFFRRGASPKLSSRHSTVLWNAVFGGSLSTVKLCLDHQDQFGYVFDESDYNSVFREAISGGHEAILRTLLQRRGSKFNAEDWVRQRPGSVAEGGHLHILRLLQSKGLFAKDARLMSTTLCEAVEKFQLDMVKFLLTHVGVDPSFQGMFGKTPLYEAVGLDARRYGSEGKAEMISILLKAGADPNAPIRNYHRVPLQTSAICGDISTILLLLQYGADVTIEEDDGETPLEAAARRKVTGVYAPLMNASIPDETKRRRYHERALFQACRSDDRELALLAISTGVLDPLDPQFNETPLLVAIAHGAVPTARMLLRHGARQDVKDRNGRLPMILAAETGHDLLIKELATQPTQKAADDALGVNVRNEVEDTPLILAVKGAHLKVVQVLLKMGADKDATNRFMETAEDIAEEKELMKILEILSVPD